MKIKQTVKHAVWKPAPAGTIFHLKFTGHQSVDVCTVVGNTKAGRTVYEYGEGWIGTLTDNPDLMLETTKSVKGTLYIYEYEDREVTLDLDELDIGAKVVLPIGNGKVEWELVHKSDCFVFFSDEDYIKVRRSGQCCVMDETVYLGELEVV